MAVAKTSTGWAAGPRATGLGCAVALWAAAGGAAFGQTRPAEGEREDLLPRNVRWQELPGVRGVSFDRAGRTWFQINSWPDRGSIERMKGQVRQAATMRAPWVSFGRIVLHDSRGRVWIVLTMQPAVLLGYDPATGAWIERAAAPKSEGGPARAADKAAPPANYFHGEGFESATGRLYFGDSMGVHVLEGTAWSYKGLFEENIRNGYYDRAQSHYFAPPRFAQDRGGRVFVWAPWLHETGTVGFFVHGPEGWTHRVMESGRRADGTSRGSRPARGSGEPWFNNVWWLEPMPDGRVMAGCQDGMAIVSWRGLEEEAKKKAWADVALLGASGYAVREEAQKRLAALGPAAAPLLAEARGKAGDLEVQGRLDALIAAGSPGRELELDGWRIRGGAGRMGRDAAGNLWLGVGYCTDPRGGGLSSVVLLVGPEGRVRMAPEGVERAAEGAFCVDRRGRVWVGAALMVEDGRCTRITDPVQPPMRVAGGGGPDGRVFLTDGSRYWAYRHEAPDVRRGLPVTIYPGVGVHGTAAPDSTGRVWAWLSNRAAGAGTDDEGAGLYRFEEGQWRRMEPAGAMPEMFLQPLAEGRMVLWPLERSKPAYYFDGRQWDSYAGLRALVEKRHAELTGRIVAGRLGGPSFHALHADGARGIWAVDRGFVGLYDGRAWTDATAALACAADLLAWVRPLPGGKGILTVHHSPTAAESYREARVADGKLRLTPWNHPPLIARGRLAGSTVEPDDIGADSLGRLWMRRRPRASAVVVDKDGAAELPGAGTPVFADSRGGLWLVDAEGKLTFRDAAGRMASLANEALAGYVAIAEDPAGSAWVLAGQSARLLHLRVVPAGEGIALETIAVYDKQIPLAPTAGHLQAWVDREGNLWVHERVFRLLRYQLPSPPPASRPGGPPR